MTQVSRRSADALAGPGRGRGAGPGGRRPRRRRRRAWPRWSTSCAPRSTATRWPCSCPTGGVGAGGVEDVGRRARCRRRPTGHADGAARRRGRPGARGPAAERRGPAGAAASSPPSSARPSSGAGSRPRRPTAEALAEADELRTAILRAVSHDLRTPLASIKASATSLLQDDVDWTADDRAGVPRHDRRGDRPAQRAGRQPARHEPPRDRRRSRSRCARWRSRRSWPRALASLSEPTDRRRGRRVRDAAARRRPTRRCSSGSVANLVANALRYSPPDAPVRIEAGAVGRPGRPARHRPGPGRAAGRAASASSSRSSASATAAAAPASASAWRWPAGSSRPWAASCTLEDTPGGGLTVVVVAAGGRRRGSTPAPVGTRP